MARKGQRNRTGFASAPEDGKGALRAGGGLDYMPGKGLAAPSVRFVQAAPRDPADRRLAPGNCGTWGLAMTHAAALACPGLEIWRGWHPG